LEIVAKQTQFLLNVFFRIPSQVTYHPGETVPWKISVAGPESPFGISLLCTGIQVFCIFAGIITLIPHSQTPLTRKDILWRKTKTLVVVIALVYIINLFRLVFLLYLTYIGIDWQVAHLTLLYVSTAIGAVLFFLFLYRWVPELFIALYSLPSVLR
jgi:exosortase/archaeosortase family protein